MKTKLDYGKKVVATKKISLPNGDIQQGESFFLKDAYIEGIYVVLGIDTDIGVKEALFRTKTNSKPTKKDILRVINSLTVQYIEGANYSFL